MCRVPVMFSGVVGLLLPVSSIATSRAASRGESWRVVAFFGGSLQQFCSSSWHTSRVVACFASPVCQEDFRPSETPLGPRTITCLI